MHMKRGNENILNAEVSEFMAWNAMETEIMKAHDTESFSIFLFLLHSLNKCVRFLKKRPAVRNNVSFSTLFHFMFHIFF